MDIKNDNEGQTFLSSVVDILDGESPEARLKFAKLGIQYQIHQTNGEIAGLRAKKQALEEGPDTNIRELVLKDSREIGFEISKLSSELEEMKARQKEYADPNDGKEGSRNYDHMDSDVLVGKRVVEARTEKTEGKK